MTDLIPCRCDNGTMHVKVTTIPSSGAPMEENVDMTCIHCNGSGHITPSYQRALEQFWCRCGNPSGKTNFYDDGESAACSKHHWACADCGAVVQVG